MSNWDLMECVYGSMILLVERGFYFCSIVFAGLLFITEIISTCFPGKLMKIE